MRKLVVLALVVMGVVAAKPAKAVGPLSILNFQANLLGVYPANYASDTTLQASWTPSLNFGLLGVRGLLGVSFPKNSTGSRVAATHEELYIMFGLAPFLKLEVGGGMMVWADYAGSSWDLGANLVLGLIGPIDRIFIGYTTFNGGAGVQLARLGIGFGL